EYGMDTTHAPATISQARSVQLKRYVGARSTHEADLLPVEEPLQIRMAGENVVVTMRTPGHDEELAAGFLFTEGIISHYGHIESIRHCPDDTSQDAPSPNVINVTPSERALVDPRRWRRNLYASSSCGICGKESAAQVVREFAAVPEGAAISLQLLYTLPDKLRESQAGFEQTGGLHAAALFDVEGNLLILREDVGRHNAVDKIVGHALMRGLLPLHNHVMVVTSRASFEIVQKALAAGVTILATVSAPTSLAVELAREGGITLVAFLRQGRCNIYAGEERILA
ncbi:MAG: formate dehydrogenase accessory sulfurtransferase FdhD, partial [Chloroflexia bacterium]